MLEFEKALTDCTAELNQRVEELAVINSIQEGLAKKLDMQAIYELVGDRIRDLFDAQAVIIGSFDRVSKLEYFNYFIENGIKIKPEARLIGKLREQLIEQKHTIYIETEERAVNEFGITAIADTKMPKSLLFVPLLAGTDIKGYVSLQNVDKEHAFSSADIRLLETLANSMSVALENARLFDETTRLLKETEQRTAELGVINSVQEGLANELDMQAIYDLVGDKIRKVFNAQSIMIATLDKENGIEYFQYNFNQTGRFYPEPRSFDHLRLHLINSKQKVVIQNKEESYQWFRDKALPGTKSPLSAVFVPLIVGDKVTSYISLQNMDVEGAFSESDVRLLETLSNSMSVALENARLFDETNRLLKETEQRTAELAVINSVQDGLAKELDMQAIYDLVGDRIIKVFNAPNLVIRTFDHSTGKEHWRYAIEKGERQYIEPKPFVWHSKQLIKTQRPLHINENYLETSKKFGGAGIFVGQPTKSGIFVPMIVGGVVKGSVSLQNVDKEHAYNEADLRLLTTITNSMSVALENARLFDETTRLLKETEQRTAELAVINSIQEGLAHELDMQSIYTLVGDRLIDVFKAQAAIIATIDIESGIEFLVTIQPMSLEDSLEWPQQVLA